VRIPFSHLNEQTRTESAKSSHSLAVMKLCNDHLLFVGIKLAVDASIRREEVNLKVWDESHSEQ
jgi:hypothetical protein